MEDLYDPGGSFLQKYRSIRVGEAGWLALFWLELVTILFGHLPGAPGLFLRSRLYRPLFKSMGRGVLIGTGVVIRNPGRIELGDHVVLDDYCVLDAKGDGEGKGIQIGSRSFISRNVILGCKNGRISIGEGVSIGPFSTIHAVEESAVSIGRDVVIAAYTYLIGAPNYKTRLGEVPMAKQGFEPSLGVRVGNDVWIGAAAVVCDGATISDGAIVGAQSLVRGTLPPQSISYGSPATVRGQRQDGGETSS